MFSIVQYGRPFFGPVLFYDLIRSSRRGEQVGHRCLYAILLVCVLAAVYWSWFPGQGLAELLRSRSMTIADRARFAGHFFTSFMTAQFVVVFLITPLYTASAIAEQKERRTLDFLLITDLTDREIVLGLFGARMAKLLLLLLTGLPVLSLLEFLGGVDPFLVIAGFVATCMLMLTLGSVSILASVHAKSALSAVIMSYLAAVLLLSCALPWFNVVAAAPAARNLRTTGRITPPSVSKPGTTGIASPSSLDKAIPMVAFTFVYGVVALVCCETAVVQLRRVARAQAGGDGGNREIMTRPIAPTRRPPPDHIETKPVASGWGPYPLARDADRDFRRLPGPESVSQSTRPRVGKDPLLWKELYVESPLGLALRQLHPARALALLGLLFLIIAGLNAPEHRVNLGEYLQGWVLRMEIVVSFVLFVIVALTASRRGVENESSGR